ncbi:hypothetical protein FH972_011195 [Carpinus fangiana]|uniref:Uncharacterized protein n=1 Tax=Carpinus fangiana TaxID=176857 RepID=A0A660KXL2_9ROSI|nr:hypothetical protein FH972_011195 [Carpinus fangiana]
MRWCRRWWSKRRFDLRVLDDQSRWCLAPLTRLRLSSTMIAVQSPLQEVSPVSSMGYVWSDGASDGSALDFVPDPDSVSSSGHASHLSVVPVPQASVLSSLPGWFLGPLRRQSLLLFMSRPWKEMEEEFRWINLVAREQGRLLVYEEDIRWIDMVACEDERWEVDKELDDRKVAWLNEMKEELRLTVEWPGPKGKIISL